MCEKFVFSFILLSLLCLVDCKIWFQTNVYLTAEPFDLVIHSNQRPEDAVDDFLILKNAYIQDKAVVYEQIINYVCPHTFIHQEIPDIIVLPCDNNPPNKVLTSFHMDEFGINKRQIIQLRANYSNDFYIEMICWDKNCSIEMKELINQKITEVLERLVLSQISSQFESDNYYIVLGLIKYEEFKLIEQIPKKMEILNSFQDIDIKKAFKTLAIQYHPDKNIKKEKWASEIFKNISTAYELLINKETRKAHQHFILYGKYENEVPVAPTQSTFSFNGWNIQFNNDNGGFGGGFTFSFNF